MTHASVHCRVDYFKSSVPTQEISFQFGKEMVLHRPTEVGPKGFSVVANDLVDFAASIARIERQLKSDRPSNPPRKFTLRIKLRSPDAWSRAAVEIAEEMLHLLGNATWKLKISGGVKKEADAPPSNPGEGKITSVALLSGGLDSACGAATLRHKAQSIQLVSFSTAQRSLQVDIAAQLGFFFHAQWRWKWNGDRGRGRTFYYRTLFFLGLAAAVADSWSAKLIYQFENGILATAIPPGSDWMMTKHAHPVIQRLAERLFKEILGGKWEIRNPFLRLTKAQCVQRALATNGLLELMPLLHRTETCWSFHSNPKLGTSRKPRRMPCGVCIPCVIRRTALPGESYFKDLLDDRVKNDARMGLAFRSYFGFLESVREHGTSLDEFYHAIPAEGRSLVEEDSGLTLKELCELFRTFGDEFRRTYRLRRGTK